MAGCRSPKAWSIRSAITTPFKAGGQIGNICAQMRSLSEDGRLEEALDCLDRLDAQSNLVNLPTYACLLQQCGNRKVLAEGKRVHGYIIKNGLDKDLFIRNHLILMYNKCKRVMDARQEFNKMTERNMVSWNAMIAGYSWNGYGKEAFQLFQRMQHEGVEPDKVTFTSLLNAFATPEALTLGKQVHVYVADNRMESDVIVGTALVSMYSKCGSLEDARRMFDKIPARNLVSWNAMITGYARHGHAEEAFKSFQAMQLEGVKPDKITFISILKACRSPETLSLSKLVHANIVDSSFDSDVVVGNALVSMYVKCRSIENARRMFDIMPERDVVSWTAIITGYARQGHVEQAFKLFQEMLHEDVKPNKITYVSTLNACTSPKALALGKLVHACIIERRMEADVVVGNALVTMYGKCGSLTDACRVFSEMPERDKVSWNAMVAGFAGCGFAEEAFEFLKQMQQEAVTPDKITFISILSTCFRPEVLARGKVVHALTIDNGFELDVVVGTALVSMYSRCGNIEAARRMFNKMPERNVVSWNTMITGYTQYGYGEQAFKLFMQMQQEGVELSKVTFISMLSACASLETLTLGKLVHSHIIQSDFKTDVVVGNALVSMYVKCGKVEHARRIFDKLQERDVVSWNIMIAGYAQHGYDMESLKTFQQMQQEGFMPNEVTFISILNACTSPKVLVWGKLVHAFIANSEFESDVGVGNAIVSMYGRCGSIEDAERWFNKMSDRDVISWNAMIATYAQHGCGKEALQVFRQMHCQSVKPDKVTLISILDACASLAAIAQGKMVHAYILDSGFVSDVMVGNALVSMYSRCDRIADAQRMFDNMPERDVTSWNALIAGLAQHGHGNVALQLFQQMQAEGMKPDRFTFISIVDACASSAALRQGKLIHAYVIDSEMESDVVVGSALISMYGRCGSLEDAQRAFDKMPERNVVSWNSIIAGYAQHGHWKKALQLFQEMQIEGYNPDEITFIGVLFACSHSGLVDEGHRFFNSISQDFGITPIVEHYNCMVDLLGRAGQLDEAEDFINKMPIEPNAVTWMTLLGSCRSHGCVDRGKRAAECAIQLDPQLAPAYVALSNIYASTGRWDVVAKVRKLMADRALIKEPGCSWIEVNNMIHEFLVRERSHPQTEDIYSATIVRS